MRKILLPLLVMVASPSLVSAQHIGVYFDEAGGDQHAFCGAPSGIHEVFVVAHGLNTWIDAIAFQIDYPTSMIWLGDVTDAALSIGISPTGVALAFNPPVYGFESVVVLRARYLWNCTGCDDRVFDGPSSRAIVVNGYLGASFPVAVSWPDHTEFMLLPHAALICSYSPVESKSWGKIKSLYRE